MRRAPAPPCDTQQSPSGTKRDSGWEGMWRPARHGRGPAGSLLQLCVPREPGSLAAAQGKPGTTQKAQKQSLLRSCGMSSPETG